MKMKSWRNNNEINGLFGKDENIYSSITLKDCGLDPEWNFMQAQNVNVVVVRNVVSV